MLQFGDVEGTAGAAKEIAKEIRVDVVNSLFLSDHLCGVFSNNRQCMFVETASKLKRSKFKSQSYHFSQC